jgi:hypothetical protein
MISVLEADIDTINLGRGGERLIENAAAPLGTEDVLTSSLLSYINQL